MATAEIVAAKLFRGDENKGALIGNKEADLAEVGQVRSVSVCRPAVSLARSRILRWDAVWYQLQETASNVDAVFLQHYCPFSCEVYLK